MASKIVVDQVQATGGATFTLPTSDGSANQLLKTNGSGTLGWATDVDTGITSVAAATSPPLGGFLDGNGNYIQMEKGGDIASASPTVIDTDGDYFICTGTTGFSAMTVAADRHFFLEFAGALTMTHGAGTLDLPGGANITTAAGDVGEFVSTASNVVTSVNYAKKSGKPIITDFVNADINASAGIALSKLASNPSSIGKQTIWVPANAMKETASNGCAGIANVETTAGRPDMNVLDFDASSDEHAQFQIAMPKSWNEGTVTFQVFWCSTATDTDGVSWGLQGVSVPDNSTIDVAYGTAVVVDDANQGAAEEQLVTAESGALTIANAAADTVTYFRIFRDVSDANDTATEDARLLGCKVFFTTDAENDA